MKIETIATPSLGDRSYLVSDGEVAAVVDPQRDLDRVLEVAERLGVRITDVFETHVHNDYVTGGLALAEQVGATYHVNGEDPVAFERSPIADGDEVEVGELVVRAIATPGHTPTHLSFAVTHGAEVQAVLTGGSLLFGSVGRTDLVDADRTEELTRAQHRSALRLGELPDDAEVLPTHGFGSFCSSGDTSGAERSTIGREREANQAFTALSEDDFVADLVAGLDAYPAYYAHMAPANLAGPGAADLSPVAAVDPTELARRIHAGEWVVDLRTRRAFAADHLHGTIGVELADSASTYLGWIIPWGTPLTLLADTEEQVAAMQRQLVRIGIDRPAGQVVGERRAEGVDAAAYPVTDFAGLALEVERGGDPWVLDSRRDGEWAAGHLARATHVPLHGLLERMDELPTDATVWVHCQGGYRASIAASLVARSGRDVVLVDDAFENALDVLEMA